MKLVLATLRTLAVLAAFVLVAGLVAYLLGELPPRDGVARRTRIAERSAREAARAAEAQRDAGAPPPAVDAGIEAAPSTPPGVRRARACDDAADASLERVRLDARGHELVALACGDSLEIIGFVGETPVAVARLFPAAIDQAAPVRSFRLAADDVTGDGTIDWIVGTTRAVDATSPAIGSLHLLPGDTRGGLGEPVLLAPLAVAAIDIARFDDDETPDFVALHRPDATGSRPPEAWVFRGGASPVRLARVPLPRETSGLVAFDADADGAHDLVPTAREAGNLAMLAGDGHGTFGRRIEVAIPGAERVFRLARPEAGPRLFFEGSVPSLLTPHSPTPQLAGIDLPANPVAVDLHTSGPNATLAVLVDGLVKLVELGAAAPAIRSTHTVATSDGRIVDVVVGEFAGASEPDVVLLVERAGETRMRDLVVRLDVPPGDESVALASERDVIVRGPMHLSIPLR